jgi:hypothetical protein
MLNLFLFPSAREDYYTFLISLLLQKKQNTKLNPTIKRCYGFFFTSLENKSDEKCFSSLTGKTKKKGISFRLSRKNQAVCEKTRTELVILSLNVKMRFIEESLF